MKIIMGKKKKIKSRDNAKKSQCRALCCGSSRLSISSTTSCSEQVGSSNNEQINSLSNMAHGMVQAQLEQIISENSHQIGHRQSQSREGYSCKTDRKPTSNRENKKYVVLVAMEWDSYNPREDFKKSIMEVITCKALIEPKELKGLLNCYVSMNSSEHHQAILEAFVDVCSALFGCKKGGYVHY